MSCSLYKIYSVDISFTMSFLYYGDRINHFFPVLFSFLPLCFFAFVHRSSRSMSEAVMQSALFILFLLWNVGLSFHNSYMCNRYVREYFPLSYQKEKACFSITLALFHIDWTDLFFFFPFTTISLHRSWQRSSFYFRVFLYWFIPTCGK